ncbi:helix-turn-helix domain-containing protein [Halosimplex litoreum]|uniref:Helix-turn-helix domain-containing protein n=1 Tax=Halosimplex litoreum TaxID=1198301 RepID=A0A7T3FYW8_9EURY|nr:helix-turn-helix domain-containing protein [Halosimplex litoreum]QPV63304.1 helix-turn-helix domain-containing protein [Halosimplex litoreum]
MKRLRVSITADGREGDIHPMYGVLTRSPFVERATALQWNFTGDALGILHYVEGDAEAFAAAADDIEVVVGYDIEPAGDDAFYAYVRDATTESLAELFGPVSRGGLVVVPPIVYGADGAVTLTVFGPDEELQAAMNEIPDAIEVTVEAVGSLATSRVAPTARLTDRQREAAEAAIDLGYYDVPRTADHEAVADALACSPSTAAEHLRKAESKLLRAVLRGE